jgi:hypothetical protein
MKKQLLTIILAALSFAAISQPCLQKCTGDSGGFRAINLVTGIGFTIPQHTITWNQGTFPNAFTVSGDTMITWSNISSVAGNFSGSYTVTNVASSCDTTVFFCVDVFLNTPPNASDLTYCFGSPLTLPLSQGSPAGGTYTDSNGQSVTNYVQSATSQTFTYTTSGGNNCTSSVTFTVTGFPNPNGSIIGF